MRLSRLLPVALAALLFAPALGRADDTDEFLKPDNWEGRSDIWKLDPKARTVVGETTEDPKYNNFFCSKKKYSDFELTCKVLLRDGVGNSGVQIRSERFDKEGDKQSFRVRGPQVDVGKGYWGSLYGEGVGGMMKASSPDAIKKAVKETEFNEYHILAKGTRITIKINGETMVDEDFPKLPGKDPKDAPKEGIIAFQAHAGYPKMRVEFKDIKFTDLGKK
jgi:3-keto-disaccharide hydrolase